MPRMIAQLTDAYRATDAQRIDLDQRMGALPPDDIEGRDLLMTEMGSVLASRQDTLRRLALAQPQTLTELRTKASILLTLGDQDDVSKFARSLARDVVGLPDN